VPRAAAITALGGQPLGVAERFGEARAGAAHGQAVHRGVDLVRQQATQVVAAAVRGDVLRDVERNLCAFPREEQELGAGGERDAELVVHLRLGVRKIEDADIGGTKILPTLIGDVGAGRAGWIQIKAEAGGGAGDGRAH
jgi:hypothetical protein